MKVQLNSVEDLTEYASWHDLTQKNRFFYVKNMRPFKSCEFLPLITKWAVFLQTHFGGWPLSSQAISDKEVTKKTSFWWSELTCWLQQNVVVGASPSGHVIIHFLLLWFLITVPVGLQFPPGEPFHVTVFFLMTFFFILFLKDKKGHLI